MPDRISAQSQPMPGATGSTCPVGDASTGVVHGIAAAVNRSNGSSTALGRARRHQGRHLAQDFRG